TLRRRHIARPGDRRRLRRGRAGAGSGAVPGPRADSGLRGGAAVPADGAAGVPPARGALLPPPGPSAPRALRPGARAGPEALPFHGHGQLAGPAVQPQPDQDPLFPQTRVEGSAERLAELRLAAGPPVRGVVAPAAVCFAGTDEGLAGQPRLPLGDAPP